MVNHSISMTPLYEECFTKNFIYFDNMSFILFPSSHTFTIYLVSPPLTYSSSPVPSFLPLHPNAHTQWWNQLSLVTLSTWKQWNILSDNTSPALCCLLILALSQTNNSSSQGTLSLLFVPRFSLQRMISSTSGS